MATNATIFVFIESDGVIVIFSAGYSYPAGAAPPQLPHYPSKLAREGGIRNFVPNFGIEDRGDGGGVVGLASKPEALEAQLKKYAAVRV